MCRFYKKHPNQLLNHFPGAHISKRGMWKVGMQIIEEAGTNPKVQAVGVAVAGAVAWKALDVYEMLKQEGTSALDREALIEEGRKDRQAEAEQRERDRQLETEQRERDHQLAERIAAIEAGTNKKDELQL
jgi:hypothetical protein